MAIEQAPEQLRRRRRRRVGCWIRSCLTLSFLVCSLWLMIPILSAMTGLLGMDIPRLEQANEQIDAFSESPIGGALDDVKDSAVSLGLEQLQPQLENLVDSNCESQTDNAEDVAYCKVVGRDAVDCFIETGGDAEVCVDRVIEQLCSEYSGDQHEQCLNQFENVTITIGE